MAVRVQRHVEFDQPGLIPQLIGERIGRAPGGGQGDGDRRCDPQGCSSLRSASLNAAARVGVQMATRTPSSTTRSDGMRKNSVAEIALRLSSVNSHCRQRDIFGTAADTTVSRPRK